MPTEAARAVRGATRAGKERWHIGTRTLPRPQPYLGRALSSPHTCATEHAEAIESTPRGDRGGAGDAGGSSPGAAGDTGGSSGADAFGGFEGAGELG